MKKRKKRGKMRNDFSHFDWAPFNDYPKFKVP